MFLGYCKDIPIGTKIDGIVFTPTKAEWANHIVIMEQSEKGNDWFIITESKLIFHRSWFQYITSLDTSIIDNPYMPLHINLYYLSSSQRNSSPVYETMDFSARLCVKKNGKYYDCETGVLFDGGEYYKLSFYLSHYSERLVRTFKKYYYGHTFYFKCSSCNRETFRYINTSDDTLCIECERKNKIECSHCGVLFKYTDKNKIKYNNSEIVVCFDCLYNNYVQCEKCKDWKRKSEVHTIEEDVFCSKCISKINKPYISCSMCGSLFYSDSIHINKTKTGKIYCKACNLHRKIPTRESSTIRNYSFKPDPIFYKQNNLDSLYFGVELEIKTPNGRRELLSKYITYEVNHDDDFIYNKFDRSIGEDGMGGFEIVTHPFTYGWFKSEEGTQHIKKILEISKYRCEAYKTTSCGMHVHISKDQFTETHLYKYLKFIFENKNFSLLISERESIEKVNSYMNFKPPIDIVSMAKQRILPHETKYRHCAVNISCQDTVEVRIFRSTLEFNRFSKNIEFCKALFDFTKNTGFTDLNVNNFVKFVVVNKSTYPNLYSFIRINEAAICA